MRVIKIQGTSLEKRKQQHERGILSKRSFKVRRTMKGQIEIKEPQSQPDQMVKSVHSSDNSPLIIYNHPKPKQIGVTVVQSVGNSSQTPSKNDRGDINDNKSEVKLPLLGLGRVSIILGRDIISKHDSSQIIQSIIENSIRKSRLTFYGRSGGQGSFDVQKGSLKDQQKDPFRMLMRIESMKPPLKSIERNKELSMKELQFNQIQRTCPIRPNKDNYTISDLFCKQQVNMRNKVKLPSQSLSNRQLSAKKQRKTLSSLKQTNNQRKIFQSSYLDFCHFITLMNKMERPVDPITTYRAFVGKGNNSMLIKSTIKNRFWWNVTDSETEANLYWTQHRDNKFLNSLKSSKDSTRKHCEVQTVKGYELILTLSKQNDKNDCVRKHVGQGLHKLLCQEDQQECTKSPFQISMPVTKICNKFDHPNKIKIHNHLQFNWNLCNKKALYYNMRSYYRAMKDDPFQHIPLTFHAQVEGDEQWVNFEMHYKERLEMINARKDLKKRKYKRNLWIIKPGQNSNQGCGITVSDSIQHIRGIVRSKGEHPNGKHRSHIIQNYLMPLLYNRRKFDIRCYILITSVNNILKAYWYEEGYIRTSSKDFNTKNLKSRLIHLTNDAVQKRSQEYGKYENGNKVSFTDLQKYIQNNFPDKQWNFYNQVYPRMMKLASDAVKSVHMLLDANNRQFSFEILGLDFMIDQEFKTWLIQVNNNPCLELGSPLLARIVPNMVENAFRIALDPIFPPPKEHSKTKSMPSELFESNKFSLIFDSQKEGQALKNILKGVNLHGIVQSDEEEEGIEHCDNLQ